MIVVAQIGGRETQHKGGWRICKWWWFPD